MKVIILYINSKSKKWKVKIQKIKKKVNNLNVK
jgi:hypothetical protein